MGHQALSLAAKLANSVGRSNTLHKTHPPVEFEAVRGADDARLKGQRRIRAENKEGDFVYQLSTPKKYQLANPMWLKGLERVKGNRPSRRYALKSLAISRRLVGVL
jgi:hypothetical protein